MKLVLFFKRILPAATFAIAVLLSASCSENRATEDTKEAAEERNDEKFENDEKERDAQFLVMAAENNLEQIELGRLAQEKATAEDVREFGKILENAHTKSQADLTALAETKSIAVPTSSTHDAKDTYEGLNEKSQSDFNENYANLMVSRHEDAVEAFEEASAESQDNDIQNYAAHTLPALRKHLDRAREYQQQYTNMYLEQGDKTGDNLSVPVDRK